MRSKVVLDNLHILLQQRQPSVRLGHLSVYVDLQAVELGYQVVYGSIQSRHHLQHLVQLLPAHQLSRLLLPPSRHRMPLCRPSLPLLPAHIWSSSLCHILSVVLLLFVFSVEGFGEDIGPSFGHAYSLLILVLVFVELLPGFYFDGQLFFWGELFDCEGGGLDVDGPLFDFFVVVLIKDDLLRTIPRFVLFILFLIFPVEISLPPVDEFAKFYQKLQFFLNQFIGLEELVDIYFGVEVEKLPGDVESTLYKLLVGQGFDVGYEVEYLFVEGRTVLSEDVVDDSQVELDWLAFDLTLVDHALAPFDPGKDIHRPVDLLQAPEVVLQITEGVHPFELQSNNCQSTLHPKSIKKVPHHYKPTLLPFVEAYTSGSVFISGPSFKLLASFQAFPFSKTIERIPSPKGKSYSPRQLFLSFAWSGSGSSKMRSMLTFAFCQPIMQSQIVYF